MFVLGSVLETEVIKWDIWDPCFFWGGGSNLMQVYDDFEGFHPSVVVWVGNRMTPCN